MANLAQPLGGRRQNFAALVDHQVEFTQQVAQLRDRRSQTFQSQLGTAPVAAAHVSRVHRQQPLTTPQRGTDQSLQVCEFASVDQMVAAKERFKPRAHVHDAAHGDLIAAAKTNGQLVRFKKRRSSLCIGWQRPKGLHRTTTYRRGQSLDHSSSRTTPNSRVARSKDGQEVGTGVAG